MSRPRLSLPFSRLSNGLYGFDTSKDKPKNTLPSTLSLFSTVAANKELYSQAEIEGAQSSRTLQARIGWPADPEFKEALSSPGTLYNSHLTADDVTRAFDIFGGRARELIKGKEVRRKKKLFDNIQRIQIPAPLLQKHKFDDLDVDFMFCNGKPFLVTLSRNILFQALQSFHRISKVDKRSNRVTYQRGKRDIVAGINRVLHMYGGRGINITPTTNLQKFEMISTVTLSVAQQMNMSSELKEGSV